MLEEQVYQTYLDALCKGDAVTCQDIVEELLARSVGLRDIYVSLFQRSMYDIGEAWAQNRISVAVEHLATALTESLVQRLYPVLFTGERNGLKAIVACTANEYHQLGGKMVADMLEARGWSSLFLGANTPPESLIALTEVESPALLALSLSVYMNFERLYASVEAVRRHFPQLPVIVGGQAFLRGGREIESQFARVTYVPTLDALDRFAQDMEQNY